MHLQHFSGRLLSPLKLKEIFCLSLQPLPDSFLEHFIVRIVDNTKVKLQIAEQKIVTGSKVKTVCRVV